MKLSALIVSTALFLLFTETETRPTIPNAVVSNERKKILDSIVYIESARLEMKMDSIKVLLEEELQLTNKTKPNTNDKRWWLRLRQVK